MQDETVKKVKCVICVACHDLDGCRLFMSETVKDRGKVLFNNINSVMVAMDVYQKIRVQGTVNMEKYAWKNVQLVYMDSNLQRCLMENKTVDKMTISQSQTHVQVCSR